MNKPREEFDKAQTGWSTMFVFIRAHRSKMFHCRKTKMSVSYGTYLPISLSLGAFSSVWCLLKSTQATLLSLTPPSHPCRSEERPSLLGGHPAPAVCRLHAQVWQRAGGASQPAPVPGYASPLQHRGPGEGLAQLPQVWGDGQVPHGLHGMVDALTMHVCRWCARPIIEGASALSTLGTHWSNQRCLLVISMKLHWTNVE